MAQRSYENFDVRIEKAGDGYRARVWSAASGEGDADFSVANLDGQLEGFLFKVGQARRRSRRGSSGQMEDAKKFGGLLFDAVFRDRALECLQRSLSDTQARGLGLRIRLRLAEVPELSDMPWEFLYSRIRNQFLSLSTYTPIIRYLECPESIRSLEVSPPLRVLVVISSPSDFARLDVEREWNALNEALGELVRQKLIVLERLDSPRLGRLDRCLRQSSFHILHFIGHGEFSEAGGELVFEDDHGRGRPVPAERLGTILSDHHSLRLVVLNACEGARSSRTDPFAGTAQTLVRKGIPAVLAMQFEISDDAAIALASEFYTSVAVGAPIDNALGDARRALYTVEDEQVEWATPVLYLRSPDGRIFDVVQTEQVKRKRADDAARERDEAEEAARLNAQEAARKLADDAAQREEEARRQTEIAARRQADEQARLQAEIATRQQAETEARRLAGLAASKPPETPTLPPRRGRWKFAALLGIGATALIVAVLALNQQPSPSIRPDDAVQRQAQLAAQNLAAQNLAAQSLAAQNKANDEARWQAQLAARKQAEDEALRQAQLAARKQADDNAQLQAQYNALKQAEADAQRQSQMNAAPPPLFRTSYDCGRASNSVERLICHNAGLAQLDLQIAGAYAAALQKYAANPAARGRLTLDQRAWMQSRNGCANDRDVGVCIERAYRTRIEALNGE